LIEEQQKLVFVSPFSKENSIKIELLSLIKYKKEVEEEIASYLKKKKKKG